MNSQPDLHAELRDLCNHLIEGRLSDSQRSRLEALVLGDSELRREYVEWLHLHAALRQQAAQARDLPLAEVIAMEPSRRSAGAPPFALHRWQRTLLAAAAAVVLLLGGIWLGQRRESGPTVARLAETKSARWESGRLPTEAGARLGPGRLRLAEGLATFVFQSGARVSLEAPAELELISANRCFLHSGALVAHVPTTATGFVVETAHARLVDHGTDFGVTADATGQAQVQVFQGEVELQHHRSGQNLRLTNRKTASITAGALAQQGNEDAEATRSFARTREPRNANEVLISSASGRGQAAYIASPGTVTHHSDTLLLLKNASTAGYRRKALLRFDLAAIAGQRATEASLSLVFEPTGFGFATFLDDAEFAVYGVMDETLDNWSEDHLTWENAPAASEDAGSVDTTKAVKLGTFTIPQGTLGGAFSIKGGALTQFINADRNGLATMVVVRETKEPPVRGRGGGVVHGFAGNHHPTLAPPTLRITLADRRVATVH